MGKLPRDDERRVCHDTHGQQCFFIIFASFAMTGAHHGTGQHASVIPPNELPLGLKVSPTSIKQSFMQ